MSQLFTVCLVPENIICCKGVASGSSFRKGKENVVEVEESEDEFEDIDFDDSGEETEGYASLSDKDDVKYFGEEEE